MTTPKPAAVAPLSTTSLTPLSDKDEFLRLTAEDGNAGLPADPSELLLPRIALLQNPSPVCDTRSADFRDGASPGRFQFFNTENEFRDEFTAVPILAELCWIEWGSVRNTGGPYGRFLKLPEDAETRLDPENKKPQWVRRGSANVLEQTRELFTAIDGRLFLMPFRGAGHTVLRRLLTYAAGLRHPNGGPMPLYSHRYHVVSARRQNNKGVWFEARFQDIGETSVPEYLAAREMHAMISRGAFRVMSDAASPMLPAA